MDGVYRSAEEMRSQIAAKKQAAEDEQKTFETTDDLAVATAIFDKRRFDRSRSIAERAEDNDWFVKARMRAQRKAADAAADDSATPSE